MDLSKDISKFNTISMLNIAQALCVYNYKIAITIISISKIAIAIF